MSPATAPPERFTAKAVLISRHMHLRRLGRVEPLAYDLQRSGRGAHRARGLVRHIGETLLIQRQMVGHGEVGDEPDVLRERHHLKRLFLQLEGEYELRERQLALEPKLVQSRLYGPNIQGWIRRVAPSWKFA